MQRETSEQRLSRLKQLLADERASPKPAKLYIMDLLQSIEDIETSIDKLNVWNGREYEMVKG